MKKSPGLVSVVASLLVPISWGLVLYFVLCAAIESRTLDHEMLRRYLLGHPVSRITTAMLCVGLAALAQILLDCWRQLRSHRLIQLDSGLVSEVPDASTGGPADDVRIAHSLLDNLNKLSKRLHGHLLHRRLQAVVANIARTGSTESASAEMRILSDADSAQGQQRYSLVRILIWATPMLGFLGTVMGISQALGNLNIGPDNDLQQMMGGLQASLYVAFDTTALALVFSMVLMFALFFVERAEGQLLRVVDDRAQSEIDRFFQFSGSAHDAHGLVRSWGRRMLAATRQAVREHTEIWRESLNNAERAWASNRAANVAELQSQLNTALQASMTVFADTIGNTVEQADQRLAQRWQQWQTMLSETARQLDDRHQLTLRQSQLIAEVLAKLENLGSIQQSVDRSLETLATTGRLDSALTGLTQAISQLRADLQLASLPQPEQRTKPFRVRIAEATRRAA